MCGKTLIPPEVSWFSVNRSEKDSRVKSDSLISLEDVKAMINAAENERNKALISVLYEAGLHPGELLSMNIISVRFKEDYCLIMVNGKTRVRRIPLVTSFRLRSSGLRNIQEEKTQTLSHEFPSATTPSLKE